MDAKTPAADDLTDTLRRIAEALERLSPRVPAAPDLAAADAFVWHPDGRGWCPSPRSIGSTCRCCAGSTACATC